MDLINLYFKAVQFKVKSADRRTVILINESERDLILGEMRDFLISTQQIVQASANDKMEDAAQLAKGAGRAAQQAVPASLNYELHFHRF